MTNSIDFESAAFQIISFAGDAKSETLIALREMKAGNYEEARKLLKQAGEKLEEASNVHLKLLSDSINTEDTSVPFLLIHAEDHYSTASYSHELISELIDVFEAKDNK